MMGLQKCQKEIENENNTPRRTNMKGIDWSKKDMYEGIGRPDLKPKEIFGLSGKEEHEALETLKAEEQNENNRSNIN